jgi:O-antigen ligase
MTYENRCWSIALDEEGDDVVGGGHRLFLAAPFFLALVFCNVSIDTLTGVQGLTEKGPYHRSFVIGIYSFALLNCVVYYSKVGPIIRGGGIYYTFFLLFIVSTVTSGNMDGMGRAFLYFVGAYVVCLSAVAAYRDDFPSFVSALSIFGAVGVFSNLIFVHYFPDRAIDPNLNRWIGMTSASNGLGVTAMIAVWASVMRLLSESRLTVKLLNLIVISGAFVCLHGADSKMATVISGALVAAIPVFKWLTMSWRVSPVNATLICMGVTLPFIVLHYVINADISFVQLFFSTIGRDSTFTGRTSIWATGFQIVAANPIWGVGFQETVVHKGVEIGHFHNGYLDLAVRGGVVGLSLLLMVLVLAIIRTLRIYRHDSYLGLGLLSLLIMIIIHNLTEGTFGKSLTTIWLLFTFVHLVAASSARTLRLIR